MVRITEFADTCEITGIKTGVVTTGEILKFKENEVIIATIKRSARVTLHWKDHANLYIGSMAGIEFTSPGPESYSYRTTR